VIPVQDVEHIYELPLALHREGVDDRVLEKLNIWASSATLDRWDDLVQRIKHPQSRVRIGIVGKYVHLTDTYKSLNEALAHGGLANQVGVDLHFIDSAQIDPEDPGKSLAECDGILVPGGFGERGTEGKIAAIRYARENGVPFFGICLGLQLATIEFARHVLGLHDAASREFDPAAGQPVIDFLDEQRNVTDKGGTMRLGAFPCDLAEGSLARRIYGRDRISERHRHRLEVNPSYHARLLEGGLKISGLSPDRVLVEIVEIEGHPWFLGCQFHPEFKSRPLDPHPLFSSYVRAAAEQRRRRTAERGRPVEHAVDGQTPAMPRA
jgi:CTP synthase